MRNLLSCLAIAMFAGILGCGEATTPTATDAQPTGATGDMMAVSIYVPGMT